MQVFGIHYSCFMQRSCHEWNGAGQSRPEQEITTNGEESQTEYFGHISCHTSLEKDINLGTMAVLRRQVGQRKEWSDDPMEWTGKTISDLVWKAEDRLAFQRFVYEVAHARASGTAPWLIASYFRSNNVHRILRSHGQYSHPWPCASITKQYRYGDAPRLGM